MGYADLHIHIKNNSDNKNGQSVEEILKEASVPLEQIDNIDGRLPKFRFAEYKAKNL